ncbi:MAG: hypothetical protein GX075_14170 [Firmicutes bacterium]|nr:hypothetical protein [Bacillota bacterium]
MDDNKVAVLLEELMAQFRTFGEGLDILQGEIKKVKNEVTDFRNETKQRFLENGREHQQLMQMIKELDTEVIKLKRIK